MRGENSKKAGNRKIKGSKSRIKVLNSQLKNG